MLRRKSSPKFQQKERYGALFYDDKFIKQIDIHFLQLSYPNMTKNIRKVVPIILRKFDSQNEILVFRHPLAGIQIVKGTVEEDETLEVAALRELKEESGINDAFIDKYFGIHCPMQKGPNWHVFLCKATQSLPEYWQHFCADDGGLVFSFFWHSLNESPNYEWHSIFQELLQFIQQKMIESSS